MKKFRFTLQALQTVRERHEHLALQNYAQAVRARTCAQEALQEVERECAGVWQRQRAQRETVATVVDFAQSSEYAGRLAEWKQQCVAALAQAERGVDQAWEKLVLARRAREVVVRFHQRQRDRYAREWARAEQKEMDEFAQHRPSLAVTLGAVDGGF